jgi:Big-like domain-containing protein
MMSAMFTAIANRLERVSKFWVATVAAGMLIVIVIVLTLIKLVTVGSECGSVKIASPSSGATIRGSVKVAVEAEQPPCIASVSYSLAGVEFAKSEAGIFETELDPIALKEKLPESIAGEYDLTITVETNTGRTEPRADSVKVKIEFPDAEAELSLEKIREMSEKLATRINQRGEIFVFADEFLDQIRSATRSFRTDMFIGAEGLGANIRRTSNSVGIPSQLMFLLAASRSRFSTNQVTDQELDGCGVDPDGSGAFKVPRSIMNQFGVKAAVDQETVTQVAARHLKELIQGQRDDFLYAIACFGEPSARIGDLFQRNDPQARRNFYQLVERGEIRPEESKRVICFFAAGIVAENPEKFGVKARSFVDIY